MNSNAELLSPVHIQVKQWIWLDSILKTLLNKQNGRCYACSNFIMKTIYNIVN